MNGKEWSASISSATTVFAICINERIPSCMRAPPEAVTTTRGTASSMAAATSRDEALAHHRAHGTAEEAEVHDPQRHAPPGQAQRPVSIASDNPVSSCASASRST